MFRFDNILEHWATIYKPISHTPDPVQKHNAFYRVDVIDGDSAFVRNFNTAVSPALTYITSIDAQCNSNGSLTHTFGFYLMIKQATGGMAKSSRQKEDEEAECKAALVDMFADLYAYLLRLKKAVANGKIKDAEAAAGLRGLDLDSMACASVPERYNGWWLLGAQIDCLVPSKRCIVEERYKDGALDADGFPVSIV